VEGGGGGAIRRTLSHLNGRNEGEESKKRGALLSTPYAGGGVKERTLDLKGEVRRGRAPNRILLFWAIGRSRGTKSNSMSKARLKVKKVWRSGCERGQLRRVGGFKNRNYGGGGVGGRSEGGGKENTREDKAEDRKTIPVPSVISRRKTIKEEPWIN